MRDQIDKARGIASSLKEIASLADVLGGPIAAAVTMARVDAGALADELEKIDRGDGNGDEPEEKQKKKDDDATLDRAGLTATEQEVFEKLKLSTEFVGVATEEEARRIYEAKRPRLASKKS